MVEDVRMGLLLDVACGPPDGVALLALADLAEENGEPAGPPRFLGTLLAGARREDREWMVRAWECDRDGRAGIAMLSGRPYLVTAGGVQLLGREGADYEDGIAAVWVRDDHATWECSDRTDWEWRRQWCVSLVDHRHGVLTLCRNLPGSAGALPWLQGMADRYGPPPNWRHACVHRSGKGPARGDRWLAREGPSWMPGPPPDGWFGPDGAAALPEAAAG